MKIEQYNKAQKIHSDLMTNKARLVAVEKVIGSVIESIGQEKETIMFPVTCPLTGTVVMITLIEWRALLENVNCRINHERNELEFNFKEL